MSWKNLLPYVGIFLAGLVIGLAMCRSSKESFIDVVQRSCQVCRKPRNQCECPCAQCNKPRNHCGCQEEEEKEKDKDGGRCDKCPKIDWSRYILKASIPPCPAQPDLTRYMLKPECPALPDMSRYILKTAVPACPPCISTCNKPCKIGDCPPCPRPRCPVVQCPEPKTCPPCAPVEPPRCPEPKVSCKANYKPEEPWMVRPLMASITGL
jgi:hypothetical protein